MMYKKTKGIIMGKNKNKKKISVSVDTNDNGSEQITDEKLLWDDLIYIRDDTAKLIMGQQIQIHELAKSHEKDISNDKDTLNTVKGLMHSLNDIALELQESSMKHAKVITDNKIIEYKKGEVNRGDDEELEYIRITGEYITIAEKVSTLASTAYMDIFSKLKVDEVIRKELADAVIDGSKAVLKEQTKLATLNVDSNKES